MGFLQALDPDPNAIFRIEHFTDAPKSESKPKTDPLLGQHQVHSAQDLIDLMPKLVDLNNRGAGIFVAVNQLVGGRKKTDLQKIRGCHADFDSCTKEQIENVSEKLMPSIIVKSSPGKYHMYWLLQKNECLDMETVEGINRCLVQKFGADKAAIDVSRLLRLPGFTHQKYRGNGQTPEVQYRVLGGRYKVADLVKAFPPIQKTTTVSNQSINLPAANPVTHSDSRLQLVISQTQNHLPHIWNGTISTQGLSVII